MLVALTSPDMLEHFDLPEGFQGTPEVTRTIKTAIATHWEVRFDGTGQGSSEYIFLVFSGNKHEGTAKFYYETAKEAFEALPNQVPEPLAQGILSSRQHFVLYRLQVVGHGLFNQVGALRCLKSLHDRTDLKGYGFGNGENRNEAWVDWFRGSMGRLLDTLANVPGFAEEIDQLKPMVIDELIPKLLDPAKNNGVQFKSGLVHESIKFDQVKADPNDAEKPIFNDFSYFYGPEECKSLSSSD